MNMKDDLSIPYEYLRKIRNLMNNPAAGNTVIETISDGTEAINKFTKKKHGTIDVRPNSFGVMAHLFELDYEERLPYSNGGGGSYSIPGKNYPVGHMSPSSFNKMLEENEFEMLSIKNRKAGDIVVYQKIPERKDYGWIEMYSAGMFIGDGKFSSRIFGKDESDASRYGPNYRFDMFEWFIGSPFRTKSDFSIWRKTR